MPRPKKDGAPEPKRRSRHGCWPCKSRKIKCGEEKPKCLNCERSSEKCDYSIRLNWDGRAKRPADQGQSVAWTTETPSDYATFQSHPTPCSTSPEGSHPGPFVHPSNVRSVKVSPPSMSPLHKSSPGFQWVSRGGEDVAMNGDDMSNGRHKNGGTFGVSHRSDAIGSARLTNVHASHDAPYESERRKLTPINGSQYGASRDYFNGARTYKSRIGAVSTLPTKRQSHYAIPASPPTPGLSPHPPSPVPKRSYHDIRRLSVKSLLHSPEDLDVMRTPGNSQVYGFDQGRPDLDVKENDDASALVLMSPATTYKELHALDYFTEAGSGTYTGFGFGLHTKDLTCKKREYYAEPVAVKIPPLLEPLPSILKDYPMNLLYFHHFLNHTASLLVPHDCPENPFRSVLPHMALSNCGNNTNLLNLMLAYSAAHRARLLNHKDPKYRIAKWVEGVFPRLRKDLDDDRKHIKDDSLATAIMLASLDIVSPDAFAIPIAWHQHLTIARQIIVARGGHASMCRDDKVAYFLSRWFAYLDVLGSLSGCVYDRPLHYDPCPAGGSATEAESEIDCVLGFTSRCITILAKIADLAKQCDSQRIGLKGVVRSDWQPSEHVKQIAASLKGQLQEVRPKTFRGCTHCTEDATHAESFEMSAVNDMFHWAGLIHLYRRVLGKSRSNEGVQIAVREIISALERIRKGGSAEASIIFPLFTAGCESKDVKEREIILSRLKAVEPCGMTQVHRARQLMEDVWATGSTWEALSINNPNQFIG